MPDIDDPLSLLKGDPESPIYVALKQAEVSIKEGQTSAAKEQCRLALEMPDNVHDVLGHGLGQAYQAFILGQSDQQKEREEGDKAADVAMEHFRSLTGQYAPWGQHNEAITWLIRAFVHCEAQDLDEARSLYQASREHLERLLNRQRLPTKTEQQTGEQAQQANEYRTLIQQIDRRLEEIAEEIAKPYTLTAEPHMPPAEQQIPTPKRHEPASDGQITVDSLFFLPVIGPIPAGQTRISSDDIQDIVAAVDQVNIDGTRYYLKRLRGEGGPIRLNQREYDHYLSRVIGDSMNQARIHNQANIHIDEGDYVMLRQPRGSVVSPDPGDIVAASIADIDREVTLKRYKRQGNTIILEPESSNPKHKRREFHEGDPEVTIVATAIAVLKPSKEGEHQ